MIDGGFEYSRVGFDPKVGEPTSVEIEVKQTKQELYDDWNKSKDKYGIIKDIPLKV